MRTFDPAKFPDIIPALIDALQNDPTPSVRSEAVQSLGKLRPVSQVVGEALEQTLAKDASMRVRLQARSTLLQYHWAGYHSGKKNDVPPLTPTHDPGPVESRKYPPPIETSSSKPPLIPRLWGSKPAPPPVANAPGSPVPPKVTTNEPPLAPPLVPPAQLTPTQQSGPTTQPAAPPAPPVPEEGPKLP